MQIDTTHNLSLADLDRRSFLHPFTPIAEHMETGPRVMTRGEGVWIEDVDGKSYLDAAAGLWCVNIGYGRTEVADAIYEQAKALAFAHSFTSMGNEPSIRLADRLIGLAPESMSKVFFGNSGSDANDTNVKLVWYYNALRGKPDKLKIISREKGYHGVTIGAGSLTGLPMVHKAFNLPIREVLHTEMPDVYRGMEPGMSERDYSRTLAEALDAMIEREGPDTVGGFIAEPVMGTGGVLTPPEGYFEEIKKVLDKHDVLLIADEVICGFGRLGSWFGSLHYGFEPDIMTIAKGLTSGYVPMSGSMISDKIWQTILDASPEIGPFGHGFTYTAHPVAAAAGLANLDLMERDGLVENAKTVGRHLQAAIRARLGDHPLVGDIRGVGLMLGVELVADKAKKTPFDPTLKVGPRTWRRALAEGLAVRALPHGNTIAFSPPLVISPEEIDLAVARFEVSLNDVMDELVREGSWRAS